MTHWESSSPSLTNFYAGTQNKHTSTGSARDETKVRTQRRVCPVGWRFGATGAVRALDDLAPGAESDVKAGVVFPETKPHRPRQVRSVGGPLGADAVLAVAQSERVDLS